MHIAIYLAGSIKKGHERSDEFFWTDSDMQVITDSLKEFEISFLNPAFRTDDLSHQFSVFGRDMTQVFSSHFVFVDARSRRGLGVGAEMMWAKVNKIPVVSWAPVHTHYHKKQTTVLDVAVTNFIHPFVESLSDKIVDTLEEAAQWVREVVSDPAIPIKDISHVHAAMDYYQSTQLPKDVPMRELLAANESLQKRMLRERI